MGKLTIGNGSRRGTSGHTCNPAADAEVVAAVEAGSLRDGSTFECECGKRYRYYAPREATWKLHRVVKRKAKVQQPPSEQAPAEGGTAASTGRRASRTN